MSAGATEIALASRPLLFVSVATTGTDPMLHEIVELSAVKAHPALLFVQREMSTRVRPLFPERCSAETAARIGFEASTWRDASHLQEVLAKFSALAENCILAGHNVCFTMSFLASGFRRAGLAWPRMHSHVIDTASLAWPLVTAGILDSLSLAAVCDALGIRVDGSRSTRREVACTMEVYRRLMAGRVAAPARATPPFEGDEDAILAALAARLSEGSRSYGTWNVSDGRNNAGEALLEILDALNYCAAELVRLARARNNAALSVGSPS